MHLRFSRPPGYQVSTQDEAACCKRRRKTLFYYDNCLVLSNSQSLILVFTSAACDELRPTLQPHRLEPTLVSLTTATPRAPASCPSFVQLSTILKTCEMALLPLLRPCIHISSPIHLPPPVLLLACSLDRLKLQPFAAVKVSPA